MGSNIRTVAISLLDILTYTVQYQPDKQAYIFLQNGETKLVSCLNYGNLSKIDLAEFNGYFLA